jgi:hypothetical protein
VVRHNDAADLPGRFETGPYTWAYRDLLAANNLR